MELCKITTSLELSKELKENGFKQDSCFYWWTWIALGEKNKSLRQYNTTKGLPNRKDRNIYSAPTAEELLEELLKFDCYECLYDVLTDVLFLGLLIGNENDFKKALSRLWIKKNNLLENK
jgi:hypothetical protein